MHIARITENKIDTTYISNVLVRGENKSLTIGFDFYRPIPDRCFLMYQREGDEAPYIVEVEKVSQIGIRTELRYKPSIHFCAKAGEVRIQLVSCDVDPSEATEEQVVDLTEVASIFIADSMTDPEDPEVVADLEN